MRILNWTQSIQLFMANSRVCSNTSLFSKSKPKKKSSPGYRNLQQGIDAWLAPSSRVAEVLFATTLIALSILGRTAACAGSASIAKGALRVAFWGAFAMVHLPQASANSSGPPYRPGQLRERKLDQGIIRFTPIVCRHIWQLCYI